MAAEERRRGESPVFALLVGFVFVQPWRHALTVAPGVSVGSVLGVGLIGSWVVLTVSSRSVRRVHPFHLAFGLFVALSASSLAWTIDGGRTLRRLATLGYTLALVVVAWNLLDTRRRLALVAQALVLGTFVVGGAGLVDLLQQGTEYSRRELAGINANELARWVLVAVPFAGGLLCSSTRFRTGVLGSVNVAYLSVVPFVVLATGSRQGLIGSLVLVVVGLIGLARREWDVPLDRGQAIVGVLVVGSVVAVVRTVASIGLLGYRLPVVDSELGTAGGRTAIWAVGLAAFRERPLLGVGAGAFGAVTEPPMGADPHSAIVGVAVELGTIGLLVAGLVVSVLVVTVARNPGPTVASAAVLGVFAVFGPVAMLYNNPMNWLVLVLVVAAHEMPAETDPVRVTRSQAGGGSVEPRSHAVSASDEDGARRPPSTRSAGVASELATHPVDSDGVVHSS